MNSDSASRLAYLSRTVDLLWPDAGSRDAEPMVVLPGLRAPRVLVPARHRRAAAAAVLRYTAQQPLGARLRGAALATGVLAGLCSRLPAVSATRPSPDLQAVDAHLGELLGHRVTTSLALTHDRPNRKPVLQVCNDRGHTVAFAKVGVTPLASRLVDTEAHALARLAEAGLTRLETPRVLHHGQWQGCALLVLSALPVGRAVAAGAPELRAAMREVATTGAGDAEGYLASLRARAEVLGDAASEWSATVELVAGSTGLDRLPMGAWHGDWTVWNCARRGKRLWAWDWERFAAPAPLGFDLLHFTLNHEVWGRGHSFPDAAAVLLARAPGLLDGWVPADAARTAARLYLLDLALRYLADGTTTGGAADVRSWAFEPVRRDLGAAVTASRDLRVGPAHPPPGPASSNGSSEGLPA